MCNKAVLNSGIPLPALDPFEEQEVMLQTWRREGGGLLPISTFPVGMHLPGCLAEVPSALFDSTSKQKVVITVFSPELFSAIQMLPGLWDNSRNQVISIQP